MLLENEMKNFEIEYSKVSMEEIPFKIHSKMKEKMFQKVFFIQVKTYI